MQTAEAGLRTVADYMQLPDDGPRYELIATGAPDLAVEIISPGAERRDRELKRKVFVRSGVEELWLILPDTKRIEIYRLAEDPERPLQRVSGSDRFEPRLFPGLTIAAAEVFAD